MVPAMFRTPFEVKVMMLPVVPVVTPPLKLTVPPLSVRMSVRAPALIVLADIVNNPPTVKVPSPTAIVQVMAVEGTGIVITPVILREYVFAIVTLLLAATAAYIKVPATVTLAFNVNTAPLAILIFPKLAVPAPAFTAAVAPPKVTVEVVPEL